MSYPLSQVTLLPRLKHTDGQTYITVTQTRFCFSVSSAFSTSVSSARLGSSSTRFEENPQAIFSLQFHLQPCENECFTNKHGYFEFVCGIRFVKRQPKAVKWKAKTSVTDGGSLWRLASPWPDDSALTHGKHIVGAAGSLSIWFPGSIRPYWKFFGKPDREN